MPRYNFERRHLSPPVITADELRALTHLFASDTSSQWNVWSHDINVYDTDLERFLDEASAVKGLSDFEFICEWQQFSITLQGGASGCFIEYEADSGWESEARAMANSIKGILQNKRRKTGHFPRTIFAAPGINKLTLSPAIKIGDPGFQLRMNWNAILNKSAANIISHLGMAVSGAFVGFVIGKFT